jgi:hypothetical protein
VAVAVAAAAAAAVRDGGGRCSLELKGDGAHAVPSAAASVAASSAPTSRYAAITAGKVTTAMPPARRTEGS